MKNTGKKISAKEKKDKKKLGGNISAKVVLLLETKKILLIYSAEQSHRTV